MKLTNIILLLFTINISLAQKTETITIPKGIVYNYCDNKTIEKAKKTIADNLSNNNNYTLLQDNLIIGPELWKRFKDNKKIQQIEKGKVQFHVDNLVLEGKMSQELNDSKIIWDEFRKEISQKYIIRKANEEELKYYWSVISFDIDEPLLIIETKEHNYILNILKDDLKLMWLDEAPKKTENHNESGNVGFKKYQNGNEIESISKGIKETALEKVILLSTDKELKENSSIEDIKAIIDKTNIIFEELFKNSEKPGKIMVYFELQKKKNEILFAVRDDLDLEIMKEFEKRVNREKYPNSKKDSIKLQLVYKVNSFNDTE
ncbi:hypothetical protein FCR2A7T_07330 [Flavobacterium cauense R2A-7]|uniref:Uncharacterized protein n=1 Tax=Flavobacterium cauense R2A-7 TaxID=1341154 RepID=V6S2N2_9FLAO|nr:hypothetical protein [Flavobacterium cauense]ESU20961.1 hypothetical protein FCR2A7T_07330 [Flavobacterium cauense R2A-7]TWI08368.1 hypothetical protein IP98_02788 [Flavobacterium cauense R2A-7]